LALQFISDDGIALLELAVREDDGALSLSTVEEKHYQLVPRSQITDSDLKLLMEHEP